MRRFDKELFMIFRENEMMEEYITLSALTSEKVAEIAEKWERLYKPTVTSACERMIVMVLLAKAYESARGKEKALR